MWILIVIGIVFIVKEAFQEYGAEKYANRKVYGKNTDQQTKKECKPLENSIGLTLFALVFGF